jgi:hypothetical protein
MTPLLSISTPLASPERTPGSSSRIVRRALARLATSCPGRVGATAAEVFGEVPFDRAVEPGPVLGVVEAVALVLGDEVLDGDSAAAQRDDDRVGLFLGDADVVGALGDEQGSADAVDHRDRRPGLHVGLLLGDLGGADVAVPAVHVERAGERGQGGR